MIVESKQSSPPPTVAQLFLVRQHSDRGHAAETQKPLGRSLNMPANGSMNWNSTGAMAMRIASVGHGVFAATMITLGSFGLIKGDFTPTWKGVPQRGPAPSVVAILLGFVSLGC